MNNESIQIRVGDIIHMIVKHRILIIALTLGGLVVGLALSGISFLKGDISRDYSVKTSVAINALVDEGKFSSANSFPQSQDFHLAEDMVSASIYVLESDKTISTALANSGIDNVTVGDVRSNLSIEQYESTQIIEIILYWRSAEEGLAIVNAINDAASDILRETLSVGGISVINAPSASYMFGGSLNATLCALLGGLGLIIGLGISILEYVMSPTLLNTKDLEDHFGLDVLGAVPANDKYFRQKSSLLIRNNTYLDITESFASMGYILHNRLASSKKTQRIYITSSAKGEGKSTTVANLGIALSDIEKRVLLIDFNLRNPQLGDLFLDHVEYEHSLNALYRGDINEQEAITSLSGYLDILPAVSERGVIPLDSSLFALIERVSGNYDYVLMDTAPIGQSVNTLGLNDIATGAIFVVRYDFASMQEIRESLEKMYKSGVKLIGCVVNDVDSSEDKLKRTNEERATYRQRREKSGDDLQMKQVVSPTMVKTGSSDSASAEKPFYELSGSAENLMSDAKTVEENTDISDFAEKLMRLYESDQDKK